MSYKDKLLKQVDILLNAQETAMKNGQLEIVIMLSNSIYSLFTVIESNTLEKIN